MADKYTISGALEQLDNFDSMLTMDKRVLSKEKESNATFLGQA